MKTVQTDVLVIGGGGAGAMAAYQASKGGVRVTMVLKGYLERCGSTIMAPGAIAGVGGWKLSGDSKDVHFNDTVKGGSFLNEQSLVRILVEESPEIIMELEQIGALWQREQDGETYSLRIDGGHSFARCPFLEDRTGREMLRTLAGEMCKRNVQVISNTIILKLVKSGDRVAGAVGFDYADYRPILIRSKTIVLACGGAGNLYLNTSNPADLTGDGYALALEAGAELMDMEFVQFYPLGFTFPKSLQGALGALHYYIRLRNKNGERFMEKYDPERKELSTRDRVARAIFMEVMEGRGGPHGGVYADMKFHEPGYMKKMTPALCETYEKIGIDPEKEYLEVAPTCHFIMGGVKVDNHWHATTPGLYVAGENAAGVHGANRLSQNALAELLVSGYRAGKYAAQEASKIYLPPVNPKEIDTVMETVSSIITRENGIRPIQLRVKLRRLMWDKVGVFRTGQKLQEAWDELAALEKLLEEQNLQLKAETFNLELLQALENYSLFKTARCTILAALIRTESRGAHYRDDYPEKNDKTWLKHIILSKTDGSLNTATVPVDLKEIKPEEV